MAREITSIDYDENTQTAVLHYSDGEVRVINDVSKNALKKYKCNYAESPQELLSNKRKQIVQILSLIGIIIVIGLIIFFVIKCKDDNKVKHPEESGLVYTSQPIFFYATGAAKNIVLDEVLYPKNSEFEEEKDFTVKFDKETTHYTVTGIVYASNGFGVKQKKLFTVVITLANLDKEQYSYTKISCNII